MHESPQRRLPIAPALILLATGSLFAQVPCSQPQLGASPPSAPCTLSYTAGERMKDYTRRTLGPRALLTSAAVAGIQQARNSPSAWEQGMEGYGRRYTSSFGKRAISNTVQLGAEAMLGEDSRYFYSERKKFWPRMKDAVMHSLVVRHRDGGRELAMGRLAGVIAGGLLSRTWQPEAHRGIENGFRSAGISFGGYISANVFREMTRGLDKHLPF